MKRPKKEGYNFEALIFFQDTLHFSGFLIKFQKIHFSRTENRSLVFKGFSRSSANRGEKKCCLFLQHIKQSGKPLNIYFFMGEYWFEIPCRSYNFKRWKRFQTTSAQPFQLLSYWTFNEKCNNKIWYGNCCRWWAIKLMNHHCRNTWA